ncbi:MAG: hypothetical protein J7M38_15820, partial [Armatimonadetes bacterium]|nr:hypothetical protein [Armatimonadota bacterium]
VITLNRIGINDAAGTATVSGHVDHMDSQHVGLLHNGEASLLDTVMLPTQDKDSEGGFTVNFEATVPLESGVNRFLIMAANAAATVLSDVISVDYQPATGRGANIPPVIDSLTSDTIGVGRRGVANLTCVAHDNDFDTLTYEWSATGGNIGGDQPTAVWASAPDPGWYTIFCTVSDGRGGATTASISLRTLGGVNHPPVIDSLTADPPLVGQRGVSDITCTAYDVDGDPLFYSWTATGGAIGPSAPPVAVGTRQLIPITGNNMNSDNTAVWIADPNPGKYTLTCTVTDGADTVSADVEVQVMGGLPTPDILR